MNSRGLVLKALIEFDMHPGNLERITDKVLRETHIDHRDRRFVFELVYGVVRNRLLLDYTIDKFLSGEPDRQSGQMRRILQIGVYQIVFMDRVPDHAAVNESVNLAKSDKNTRGVSGLINALLRNVIKNKHKIALPDPQLDLVERLSVEFSHPRWIVERWLAQLGLSKTKKLLSFDNEKPPIYLRRKIRDISRQQFESDVRTLCEQATGYLNLYYKMKKALDPENIRLLKQGLCNVQSPSSGWIVALMDVKRGDHVVDICSAPGGKTVLISELVQDEGTVLACELKVPRIRQLVQTAMRMGLRNVYPLLCDGTSPPFTGQFDKVLLDAPCTGTGVLARHPDGRWIRTADDIGRMVQLQRKLLDSAANLTGSAGVLVYSTCSLEPEENEAQVEWFLSNHKEFKLDTVPDVIPDNYIDNRGCVKVTPYEHSLDGIFGARFVKS